jgi:hypothetical protein
MMENTRKEIGGAQLAWRRYFIYNQVVFKTCIYKWYLEVVNLLEFFNRAHEEKVNKNRRTKEFVGREKFGDNAQTSLYPNIKLSTVGDKRARGGGADVEI